MTEREALIRAVCAAPDDDLPRLVFADWLDEHGEPERAEFIRVQCELSRRAEDDPGREGLRSRAEGLLKAHRAVWVAELPVEYGYWYDFYRGFVDELAVNSDADPHADPRRAFEAAPLIALSIFGHPVAPWLPHLRHIRDLTLLNCPLSDEDIVSLCAAEVSPWFEMLLIVDTLDQIGPAARRVLAERFGNTLRFSH